MSTLLHARLETLPVLTQPPAIADVADDAWYAEAMDVAAFYGILTPDDGGKVRPEDPVTRAQFLKIVALTYGLRLNMPHSYTDVSPQDWYAAYAGIAQLYHLFPDAEGGSLQPNKVLTRPEAAGIVAFLVNARSNAESREQEEQKALAAAQATQKLQLYLTMSTQRQKVKLVWPRDQLAAQTPTVVPKGRASTEEMRQEILLLVNAARAENGVPAVATHPLLEDSAQTYAREMAVGGFFSHVSPSGQTLRDRVTQYYALRQDPGCLCVRGVEVGENLGRGQLSPEQVVNDWMKSPSHRKTMLTPEYTDIGIGIASGYWVLHFGGFVNGAGEIAAQ